MRAAAAEAEEVESMRRTPQIQTIAWFANLRRNEQIDLDPPYQRHSIWNQTYRNFFIDSILNDYPIPAIFLYQEMDDAGNAKFFVVDGKQRLETIFQFLDGAFPAPEGTLHEGKYFQQFSSEAKRAFWDFQISVEMVPDIKEPYLKDIFDRINRNVAQLKPQELRHARYDGAFIRLAEELTPLLLPGFPNISLDDKRRMRDVEYVSVLLMFLKSGPQSTSQGDIDAFYSEYDASLPEDIDLESTYRKVHGRIVKLVESEEYGEALRKSRFRNLADYYGLFGAIQSCPKRKFDIRETCERLLAFSERVEAARQDRTLEDDSQASDYYAAVRSASNDAGPRGTRIRILADIICR